MNVGPTYIRYQVPDISPPNIPAIAPERVALFHHIPKTNGQNNPDIAKSNAQATAPKIPVSLIAAI